MKTIAPDVLLYIQSIKTFIKNNDEANVYFLSEIPEDLFFNELTQLSQSNFIINGDPMLSEDQIEMVRNYLLYGELVDTIKEKKITPKIFEDLRGYDKITII